MSVRFLIWNNTYSDTSILSGTAAGNMFPSCDIFKDMDNTEEDGVIREGQTDELLRRSDTVNKSQVTNSEDTNEMYGDSEAARGFVSVSLWISFILPYLSPLPSPSLISPRTSARSPKIVFFVLQEKTRRLGSFYDDQTATTLIRSFSSGSWIKLMTYKVSGSTPGPAGYITVPQASRHLTRGRHSDVTWLTFNVWAAFYGVLMFHECISLQIRTSLDQWHLTAAGDQTVKWLQQKTANIRAVTSGRVKITESTDSSD